jgi:hypothetical protein
VSNQDETTPKAERGHWVDHDGNGFDPGQPVVDKINIVTSHVPTDREVARQAVVTALKKVAQGEALTQEDGQWLAAYGMALEVINGSLRTRIQELSFALFAPGPEGEEADETSGPDDVTPAA